MANTSIGGLVSGLDTATIISQLMQIEAQPQSRLKARVSTEQTAVNALQALNTKLSTLATKAGELAKASGWGASTATADNTKVTATAAAGATPATLTFQVVQTAGRSQAVFNATATRTGPVATPGSDLTLSYADGRSVTVNTGDGSLQAIAGAISSATIDGEDAGFDAVLVRAGGTDDVPTYRLMVTTASTGDATRFTVSNAAFLSGSVSTEGRDAVITIDGLESRSATNAFKGLMPGVDVTLQPGVETGQDVTVTVGRDAASLSDKVKGIVDALNAALTDISTVTASGAGGTKAGALSGNATLRQVRDQLLSSVTGGVGGASLAEVGIETDRYGDQHRLRLRDRARVAREAAEQQHRRCRHQPGQGPAVVHRGPQRRHRRLGLAPRAASPVPREDVRRPRSGARQAAEPVVLAGRTTRFTAADEQRKLGDLR